MPRSFPSARRIQRAQKFAGLTTGKGSFSAEFTTDPAVLLRTLREMGEASPRIGLIHGRVVSPNGRKPLMYIERRWGSPLWKNQAAFHETVVSHESAHNILLTSYRRQGRAIPVIVDELVGNLVELMYVRKYFPKQHQVLMAQVLEKKPPSFSGVSLHHRAYSAAESLAPLFEALLSPREIKLLLRKVTSMRICTNHQAALVLAESLQGLRNQHAQKVAAELPKLRFAKKDYVN